MKYSVGWTTRGPEPAGSNNSYKIAFITWSGASQRMDLTWANTDRYVFGASYGLTRTEITLPTTTGWYNAAEATEWDGVEWWEFVMNYERISPTEGLNRFWRRQLTSNGVMVNKPFSFSGWKHTATVGTLPRAAAISLGANKNNCTPNEQFILWGPYEVVDGSINSNPYGLAGDGL
jgi:hypothetical protein